MVCSLIWCLWYVGLFPLIYWSVLWSDAFDLLVCCLWYVGLLPFDLLVVVLPSQFLFLLCILVKKKNYVHFFFSCLWSVGCCVALSILLFFFIYFLFCILVKINKFMYTNIYIFFFMYTNFFFLHILLKIFLGCPRRGVA